MTLAVPEDYVFCDGHFPGTPLVPGAVLAVWMREAAREAGSLDSIHGVTNLKFRAPVVPGDQVTVTATSVDGGIRVTLKSRDQLCADAFFACE